MPNIRQAFIDWIQRQREDGERLLSDDLSEGPRYYFSKNSSPFAVDFFTRIDRWRRWLLGLITGLHHRVEHAEHLVEDARRRFDEANLLVFRIVDVNNHKIFKTFDLRREQATFTHGDGWLDLGHWFQRGREDSTWNGVRDTLLRDLRSFISMILGQVSEFRLLDIVTVYDFGVDAAPVAGEVADSRYSCHIRLGAGLFGEVWRATDVELKRDVAVKFIRSTGATRANVLEHARALARVTHPNIVTVYHVTKINDPVTGGVLDAVVMELIEGDKLEDRLGRALADTDVQRIGRNLLDGVGAYHAHGLAHLDLHAGNVMVGTTAVKILDPLYFETAVLTSTATREAQQGTDLRNLQDLLRRLLEVGPVPLEAVSRFLRETSRPNLELLRRGFEDAFNVEAVPLGKAEALPLALPDVRVLVKPAIAQADRGMSDLLSIEVQNHSPNPFYLSTITLRVADGKHGVFMADDATGRPNSPATVMPGDSHSLHISAERLRHAKAQFVAAVVTDKIGRRFESDPKLFARVLAAIKVT